jgi:hypothetical protein
VNRKKSFLSKKIIYWVWCQTFSPKVSGWCRSAAPRSRAPTKSADTTPEEEIQSISVIYPNAFLYENEIHDLFGLTIKNMTIDYHGTLYRTAIKVPFSIENCPVPEPPKPKKETPQKPAETQNQNPEVDEQPED